MGNRQNRADTGDNSPRRRSVVTVGLVVTLATIFAGCSSDDSGDGATPSTEASSADTAQADDDVLRCVSGGEDVEWTRADDAEREVESRVGEMACAADCAGLQAELDLSYDNGPAVRAKYPGEGNDALISALEATMTEIGCKV